MSFGFPVFSVSGCTVLVLALGACATHGPKGAVTDSTGVAAPASATVPAPAPPTAALDGASKPAGLRPPPESLERFIAQVRKLSMEARPQRLPATTIEGSDPQLAAALAGAAVMPSPERYREVAGEYARIGVNDRAYEYLMKSVSGDPRNPAGYDALARVWRDSGFPQRALGDAYRAVHYAPKSPIAHNTLGTVLQLLGWHTAARTAFERALQLDPTAVYALTNLCYGWLLDGHSTEAEAACDKALEIDPRFAPARNNLALTYALAGDMGAARRAFSRADDPALAQYNIGLLHLARHEYRDALESFKRVVELRPDLRVAAARVRQTQQAIDRTEEE